MNPSFAFISGEQFWLEVHLVDFVHSILVHYYKSLKILSEIHEHLFLAKVISENEHPIFVVCFNYLFELGIGLLSGWEVKLRIGKSVIKVQVVNIDCYRFHI